MTERDDDERAGVRGTCDRVPGAPADGDGAVGGADERRETGGAADRAAEPRLDLAAWAAPAPPRGLAARVTDAIEAGAGDGGEVEVGEGGRERRTAAARRAGSRWPGVVGGLVAGLAAAAALWAFWPRAASERAESGQMVAAGPAKVAIGARTSALVAAGAELRWAREGEVVRVEQTAGAVTYQHAGPSRLRVITPGGAVETAGAAIHVEVPMNRSIVSGAAGAAIAAVVVVAVYEGKAEVQQPSVAPRTVESGGQVALALPPDGGPAPPVVAAADGVGVPAGPVPSPGGSVASGGATTAEAQQLDEWRRYALHEAKRKRDLLEAAEFASATGDELVQRAEDEAKRGQWPRALRVAEAALAKATQPTPRARAHLVGALAACNLGSAAEARRFIEGAPRSSQNLIRQRCLAHGIDLERGDADDDDAHTLTNPFEDAGGAPKPAAPRPGAERSAKGGGGMLNPFAE